jgi:enoyl-CoA hydratase/carnithine racemase
MPQRMGHARAAEALLLGEPFSAESALEWGLINRIVPPTEANALAQQQARKLASKPLASLLETKRLMKMGSAAEVAQRMNQESEIFGRMLGQAAAKEAFTAFMDKRLPDFSKL